MTIKEILTGDIEVITSLEAYEFDLSKLFELMGVKNGPTGKSRIQLERIHYRRHRIDFEGTASAQIFGGQLLLYKMAVHKPFTKRASYQYHFTFHNISLKQLWRKVVDYGVLRGTVRGHGYADVYNTGEPNELWLALEAVREDEEQVLNIKSARLAIRALQGAAAAKSLEIPVDTLGYSHLGIYVTLSPGGIVRLRGKYYVRPDKSMGEYTWDELREGKVMEGVEEYLMMGSGIRRLNIINQNPRGGILLSDLLDRVERGKVED
jgi:hypothetical protein